MKNRESRSLRNVNAFDIGLIALGAALNVTVGYLVNILKVPLYFDSIGTVLITALCGWGYGVIVGLSGVIILTVTLVPTVIAYAGTAIVIATMVSVMMRFGFLSSMRMTIIGGILLGLASSAASVPVTTLLYGGVSLAGSDTITTVLKAFGLSLWESVMIGSLFTDITDKICTGIICFVLLKSLPERLRSRISGSRTLKSRSKINPPSDLSDIS